MFEKEALNEKASEHCNDVMCSVCDNRTCDDTHLNTLKCREWRDRRAGFYCGAEFGYNKGKNEAKEIIKKLLEAQIIGTWYDIADTLIEAKQFLKDK